MQFLLLLSALLSAVTGAFAGPRISGAQVDQVEAQQVSPAAAVPRLVAPAAAPLAPEPAQDGGAPAVSAPAAGPVHEAPLAGIRRIE